MAERNYIIGIVNDNDIPKISKVILQYAVMTKETSSHMFFSKQPVDPKRISQDFIFLQIAGDNETMLEKKLENMINDLDDLNAAYVLRDQESGEFLVTVKYGGQITIKFDNVKTIEQGTFAKIDELKFLDEDFGYCKGFKPNFRPVEGKSIEDLEVLPEEIYIVSDSEQNLLKLRDYIYQKVKDIDSDLEIEFSWFFR